MNRRKRQSQPPPLPQQQLLRDASPMFPNQREAHVQLLIERYLPMYMDKFQIINTLYVEHGISPSFSLIVYNKMREANSDLFDVYDIRVQLKAHILEMNEILSRLYGVPNPTAPIATTSAANAIAESRASAAAAAAASGGVPGQQFIYMQNSSEDGFYMQQQQQVQQQQQNVQSQQQQQAQAQQQMYFNSWNRKHSNSTPPRLQQQYLFEQQQIQIQQQQQQQQQQQSTPRYSKTPLSMMFTYPSK